MIDKLSFAVNNLLSCNDHAFCTIQNVIFKHRVEAYFFDTFHHYIIYGNINICVPL